MDPRIADYIRANRRRYTREAITSQLVGAGHHPDEVERTWAALDAPDRDDVAGEGFWGRFALILVGINAGAFLLVGLLTGLLQSAAGGGIVLLVVLGVALVIGALIAWGIVAATSPTKLSPTTALVIGAAIPALFALLIGGACYALVGSLGGLGSPGPPPVLGTMHLRLGAPLEIDQTVEATCESFGDPAAGFVVYAFVESFDRPPMDVSVGAHPQSPGGPLEPMVFVSFQPMQEKGAFEAWGHEMGPGGTTELEPGADALSGTVRFEDLPGSPPGGTENAEPLSGEITWECEG